MADKILITGVSGHIGFRVLEEALQAGYNVRAVVRSSSQVEKISCAPSVKPFIGQIEFVKVPDFSTEDAFDTHMEGVSDIIHVASPQLSSADKVVNVAEFAGPAVKMTENILKTASKSATVRRVVVTSSISTLFSFKALTAGSDEVVTCHSPISNDLVANIPKEAPEPFAYAISKVLAAQAVFDYVKNIKPAYSVVVVFPATTVGRNELIDNASELVSAGNTIPLAPLLGIPFMPVASVFSHIDDVAKAHIKSLGITVTPGSARKILPALNTATKPDAFAWDDVIGIVKASFPEAIASGTFPLGSSVPTLKGLVDSSQDEKDLGFRFKSYEDAVIDIISQYVGLHGKA